MRIGARVGMVAVVFLCAVGVTPNVYSMTGSGSIVVEYCDLVRNPEKYDGKEVTVRATYRYGFEWQELFCLDCRDLGKTWLEFEQELPARMRARLKKFPKHQGTVNAVFTGVFQSSAGHYGDGQYRYQLLVKEISNAEVVSKSGWAPDHLPPKQQKKVCGGESKRRRNG